MKTIPLTDYSIFIDDTFVDFQNFIQQNNYSSFLVLVDENTKEH